MSRHSRQGITSSGRDLDTDAVDCGACAVVRVWGGDSVVVDAGREQDGALMKAPKCRLCGHEHWNSEAHHFGDVVVHKPEKVVHAKPVVVHKESKHGRYADAEKRRQYRRGWMKRKRAEARAR